MLNKFTLFLLCSVLISSFSQILLKKSANIKRTSRVREYLNVYVIIGYALMLVATLLTILAYKGLDYKEVPIIESLGYILIMLLSYIFFRERITYRKLFGNALILLGIVIFYI